MDKNQEQFNLLDITQLWQRKPTGPSYRKRSYRKCYEGRKSYWLISKLFQLLSTIYVQLGVLENKGRCVRIQSCNLYPPPPPPTPHLHVTCSQKYFYCALKILENVKHYFNQYFLTTEYRANFLRIYSLGWLSGLAVTGPH